MFLYNAKSSCSILISLLPINVYSYSETSNASIDYSKENETATITFPSSLAVGSGDLALEFTGELNDKMKGFYRSKYTTPAGEERYCAVTQFEVSDTKPLASFTTLNNVFLKFQLHSNQMISYFVVFIVVSMYFLSVIFQCKQNKNI